MSDENNIPAVHPNAGNRNAEKGKSRGRIVLPEAPTGYGHQYRQAREMQKALAAEWVAKFGVMPVALAEALNGAVVWLCRARCLHKYAKGLPAGAEQNAALDQEAEAHEKYIRRLTAIGMCCTGTGNGGSGGDVDGWAGLHQTKN